VCCVPTIITSSLFIGFEHTSDDWKVEKVSYRVWYYKFSKMIMPRWSKVQFSQAVTVCQHRLTVVVKC
jgi:hypothetical protein